MNESPTPKTPFADYITEAVGSPKSLIIHTILFAGFFVLIGFGADPDRIFLVLTTIVSLEAIYLSLLIQMTVNRNTVDIATMQVDIDEIQEDVEDIAEDVDEIQKDVEHIEEEIEDIAEDVEGIERDIDEIQEDVEDLSEEDDISDPVIHQVNTNPTSESNNALLQQVLVELRSLQEEIQQLKK